MLVTVIGVRDVSFTTKDGVFIEGQSVWYTIPIESHGRGEQAEKGFLPLPKKLNPSDLPCLADLYFNRYGKIDSISIH